MGDLAKVFGGNVRARRMERGLTQPQLADLSGISEQWLRRIEAGQVSPSFDTIEALAAGLGASGEELFRSEPPAAPERVFAALGSLDEEAASWLLQGARLLGSRRKP